MTSTTDWEAYRMRRSCGDKKKYRHESQARAKAHQYKQHAYRCSLCGGFHLTSKPNGRDLLAPITHERNWGKQAKKWLSQLAHALEIGRWEGEGGR